MQSKIKNKKNILFIIIILVIILVIIGGMFLYYLLVNNYVVYDNIDNSSATISNTELSIMKKIIVNNLLLGGYSKFGFADANKLYDSSNAKKSVTVDLFDSKSSYGIFETSSFIKYLDVVFTKIAKEDVPQDYIAVEHVDDETKLKTGVVATKLEASEEDKQYVKQALKGYRWFNPTIKITEVYNAKIKENSDKIICVISNSKNKLAIGAYSAVIYVSGGVAKIVKYAFVKDTNNANSWPVYSFKFATDIDTDGVSEIVLQETTGFYNTYSLLKLKSDDKFYQVLKVSTKL